MVQQIGLAFKNAIASKDHGLEGTGCIALGITYLEHMKLRSNKDPVEWISLSQAVKKYRVDTQNLEILVKSGEVRHKQRLQDGRLIDFVEDTKLLRRISIDAPVKASHEIGRLAGSFGVGVGATLFTNRIIGEQESNETDANDLVNQIVEIVLMWKSDGSPFLQPHMFDGYGIPLHFNDMMLLALSEVPLMREKTSVGASRTKLGEYFHGTDTVFASENLVELWFTEGGPLQKDVWITNESDPERSKMARIDFDFWAQNLLSVARNSEVVGHYLSQTYQGTRGLAAPFSVET